MNKLYVIAVLCIMNFVNIVYGCDSSGRFVIAPSGKEYQYDSTQDFELRNSLNDKKNVYSSQEKHWFYMYQNQCYKIWLDRETILSKPEEIKPEYIRKK